MDIQAISIHASRGGSDVMFTTESVPKSISIHASRGGSDKDYLIKFNSDGHFNPRFPRGKRPLIEENVEEPEISIHASRGGSDKDSDQ